MQMTMVDGRVVNIVTETKSAQACSMCDASPRNVSDLKAVRRRPVTNLDFGLSKLHCCIRIFEAILHISYRLPTKKWQRRMDEHRRPAQETSKEVQRRMLHTLGLRVDEPRPGGSGNTNFNTARGIPAW